MNLTPVLLIPGLGNSGPEHWQTHWERAYPACQRLQQRDWETPHGAEWVAALDQAGHVNSASRLGLWPSGWALVERLRAQAPVSRRAGI